MSGLEVYGHAHTVIYMSAHKHHEYFTTAYDHKDSYYSDYGCNDDVNGRGDVVLVNLLSVAKWLFYNNAGEPEQHPTPPFVNDISRFYSGHSAWGSKKFYSVAPIKEKWMTHTWEKRLFKPTQLSPANGIVFDHYPRETTPCFFDLRTPEEKVIMALKMILVRVSLSNILFVPGVKEETVLEWLEHAAQKAEEINAALRNELPVTEVQLDEMWSFVQRKVSEYVADGERESLQEADDGRQWVWLSYTPEFRLKSKY